MATTIDTLQIEIQTSAANASPHIEALATALGSLKKNGSIGVAVRNLGGLAESLGKFKGLPNVSGMLSSLAGSLESIKAIGSFRGVGNSVKNLTEALRETGDIDVSNVAPKLRQIAAATTTLSDIRPGGLKSMVEGIRGIRDVTESLDDTTIRNFANRVERLNEVLEPLSRKMTTIQSGLRGINQRSRTATTGVKNLGNSVDKATWNLSNFSNVLNSLVSVATRIGEKLGKFVGAAIDWDGIASRFGRTFGEEAANVYAWIQRLNDEMYINVQQFMQYTSLYGEMLKGFGVDPEDAQQMAIGYTELAYDIWASTNDIYKSFDDATAAIRQAISGEVESIRRAGYTIIESELQQTAAKHGLTVSIENATEAQKSYLRYLTLVDQAYAKGVVGSYARELNTAEGVMRTLQQQLTSLAQAIGSLFLPILVRVVPYIQAFVEVLTDAVRALGSYFGVEFQHLDWSGYNSGVADAASGTEELVDSTKDLQRTLLGIDELNVLKAPSSDVGSNDVGAGGFEGLDVNSLWDESIFNQIQSQVEDLKPKVKTILDLVAAIGVALAAWKIGSGLLSFFGSEGFEVFSRFLGSLAGSGAGMSVFTGELTNADKRLGALYKGVTNLATFFTSGIFGKGLGAKIMGAGGSSLGSAVAAIGAAVGGIALLTTGFASVYAESEKFRTGLSVLFDFVGWIADSVSGIFKNIGENLGAIWEQTKINLSEIIPSELLDFVDALDIGLGDLLVTAGGLALFGPWGLLIEGAVLAIKGFGIAASDSLPEVEIFGEGISDVTREKVEPFLAQMDALDQKIKTLDWSNITITVGNIAEVQAQLDAIVNTIVTELDSDRNQALAKLEPLRAAFGEEKYAALLESVNESYDKEIQIVEDGEAEIMEILSRAAEEGRELGEDEAKRIAQIQKSMRDTGIKYLSESETESNLILQRLKDNAEQITAEQASEVIKNALKARDETIEAAQEQYDGICMEAQRMYDAGVITKTEYDEIIAAAEKTRDETVTAAEDQYSDILSTAKEKMGEYARYIDETTGEIKSNWEVFCGDFVKGCEDIANDISYWWENTAQPVLDDILDGICAIFDPQSYVDGWNNLKSWWEGLTLPAPDFKFPHFSWSTTQLSRTHWAYPILDALNIPTELPKLSVSWYASGGFPAMGEMFVAREAGPELVGSIGGRSAVVNNDQIVESVSRGVAHAVTDVLKQIRLPKLTVEIPKITGTVVTPGVREIATVGAYQQNATREATDQQMREAVYYGVKAAMSESGNRSTSVEAKVNKKVLFDVIVEMAREETMRTGVNPLLELV